MSTTFGSFRLTSDLGGWGGGSGGGRAANPVNVVIDTVSISISLSGKVRVFSSLPLTQSYCKIIPITDVFLG